MGAEVLEAPSLHLPLGEKLYNRQSKRSFKCIRFVFEKPKLYGTNFRRYENIFFSAQTRNFFFLISSFYRLIRFIKKRIIPRDAAWIALQSTKNSLFYCVLFIFKILCDQFSPLQKLIAQNFAFFLKQKVLNWNKLFFEDCRTFHAAPYGIFRFLIKCIRWKNKIQNVTIYYNPLVS